jgi:hypothetical protein
LTVEDLKLAAAPYLDIDEASIITAQTKLSTFELIKHSFDDVTGENLKSLFSTRRLAWSTSLVVFCYAAVGLAYPLYNAFLGTYLDGKLQQTGQNGPSSINDTYAAFTYQAACGVPGAIAAAALVEWGKGGRKFAMAFFTAGAGIMLFGLTQAKTNVQVNALTCVAAFFQNAFCTYFLYLFRLPAFLTFPGSSCTSAPLFPCSRPTPSSSTPALFSPTRQN